MKGRIYNIKNTRKIMEMHDITMKKSLGQNFLIDGNILRKIVDSADLKENDVVLEVGPGIGSLSEEILLRGNKLTSIEIDDGFIDILHENFEGMNNFKLVHGDALDDEIWKSANENPTPNVFIGNLPYVITTPILEKIFKNENKFDKIVVMVQKEVAERMTAKPGSKTYGSLSVFVSFFSNAKILFDVSEGSFIPRPKVKSSVVLLETIEREGRPDKFMDFVHTAFGMRRKTLLNSLSMGLDMEKSEVQEKIEKAGIDTNVRAENLNLNEFLNLYSIFNEK